MFVSCDIYNNHHLLIIQDNGTDLARYALLSGASLGDVVRPDVFADGEDAGTGDAGAGHDSGREDAVAGHDAGSDDAGREDAGREDAGRDEDAGREDAGREDAGTGDDAGFADEAGREDAGIGDDAGFADDAGREDAVTGDDAGFADDAGREDAGIGDDAGFADDAGREDAVTGDDAGREDAGREAGSEAGIVNADPAEAGSEAGSEAGIVNAGSVAGSEAGSEAGIVNAGSDAGFVDAGFAADSGDDAATFAEMLAGNNFFSGSTVLADGTVVYFFGLPTYDEINAFFVGWNPGEIQVLAMTALSLLAYQVQLAHGANGFVSPRYVQEHLYNILVADNRSGRIAASLDQNAFYKLLRLCAIAFYCRLTLAQRDTLLGLAEGEPYVVIPALTNDESGLMVRILRMLMGRPGLRPPDEARLTLHFRGIITFRVGIYIILLYNTSLSITHC